MTNGEWRLNTEYRKRDERQNSNPNYTGPAESESKRSRFPPPFCYNAHTV